MQPIKIKEDIYWVGGIDWDLRNFHGYLTQQGSTYNAYLIMDEKITLVDTVKHYLYDEMLERISKIIDPSKIDIIISNHVEMDHSGGLPKIMELCPKATLVTCEQGAKGLKAHYRKDWKFQIVKTGDSISLGKRTMDFILTPMVHWPDNMVGYLKEEKILFSNDSFGQHLATVERFDDEYPLDIILKEAKKYYANIVMPYDIQAQNELNAYATLPGVEIIAPSHGLIWRKHIPEIISEYQKWSKNETEERAVIVYDSMWDSTQKIARELQGQLEEKGITVQPFNLKTNHISDIMSEIQTAKYIFVGSPTLNNQMLPTVGAFLTYLKGLRPKNRKGFAFGSYGWGGQSIGLVEADLKSIGMELAEMLRVNYVPDRTVLKGEIQTRLDSLLKTSL